MQDDFSSEDSFNDEEDAEIDKIIASGKEIKLEKKKKPRKLASKTPKIEVTPVLKEAIPAEKVTYTISAPAGVAPMQLKADEGKITLTQEEKTELESIKDSIIEKSQIHSEVSEQVSKPEEKQPEIKSDISEVKPSNNMNLGKEQKSTLTAHDILTKSEQELKAIDVSKREAHNLLQDMRIITAILLGKKKNKDLSQVLQTDKSFTSKQIKDLEDQGLVKREGEGKDVNYEVDTWNVLKFLQSKVVIKMNKSERSSDSLSKTKSFAGDKDEKREGETK